MSEWQDIATAPTDGSFFLACCEDDCGHRNHWIVRCDEGDFVCYDDAEGLTKRLFVGCLGYWMPLPPAPPAAMQNGG